MSASGGGVPRRFWVGLIGLIVYVLLAAVASDALGDLLGPTPDATAQFAITHLVALPILIAAGIVFAWRSGWWSDVWHEPSVARGRPRRWWWFLVPLLLLVQVALQLSGTQWSQLTVGLVLVVIVGTTLVGVGEELYFRGILIVSLRGGHSEIVVLMVSAIVFGLAHTVTQLWQGLPLPVMLFQIAFLTMDGVLYYAVRRATGLLWVAMLVHGLTDFSLYLQSGGTRDTGFDVAPAAGYIGAVLGLLALLVLVSVIRETIRARRSVARATESSAPGFRAD
ncbi:CPBP family intramembrane glutamic endopeptidase [Subtercola sp. YIM 133946]|uniref:CPBP family intramembrane glutamic endopeptidase n=1 Tax=Subtercola sp. YIM 133946 TaxID=3118909 RepID=UPI002F94C1BA